MPTRTSGSSANRRRKLRLCWCASTVVGHNTATWRPFSTTRIAARSATSVFPNPTSPHNNRSIGYGSDRSSWTAAIAIAWSGVSSCGNRASNASERRPGAA